MTPKPKNDNQIYRANKPGSSHADTRKAKFIFSSGNQKTKCVNIDTIESEAISSTLNESTPSHDLSNDENQPSSSYIDKLFMKNLEGPNQLDEFLDKYSKCLTDKDLPKLQ